MYDNTETEALLQFRIYWYSMPSVGGSGQLSDACDNLSKEQPNNAAGFNLWRRSQFSCMPSQGPITSKLLHVLIYSTFRVRE